MDKFEQRVIISGIGQSEISRRSNNSELALTFQACRQAVADAGIDWSDIDGLSTYPGEIISTPGFSGPGVYGVQDMLRLQLNWHLGGHEMPGQLGAIIEACLAVAGGLCRHALVYRTLYEGTGQGALGRRGMQDVDSHRLTGNNQWLLPFGAVSGANWCALLAQRYFYEYGTTREQLAWVALNDRANALLNESAAMRDRGELTLDEYMNSRMISSPLCLYDCDYPVDGSVAFVISPAEHASSLDHRPVRIEAFGAAQHDRGSWTEQTDYLGMGAIHAGAQMWSRTQLRATDVGSAHLYDGFSIHTPLWLEALGFCGRGESGSFLDGGKEIARDGSLPLNTGGGQLSSGRLHGFGHLHEACLQVRGEAGKRQVRRGEVAVVGAGSGPFCGCVLLSAG